MSEPEGSFRCDVCGFDKPHAHTPWEVEQERHARVAFENLMAQHTNDSDGPVVIKPYRPIGPNSQYTRMVDAKLPDKWHFYRAGWYDCWKLWGPGQSESSSPATNQKQET